MTMPAFILVGASVLQRWLCLATLRAAEAVQPHSILYFSSKDEYDSPPKLQFRSIVRWRSVEAMCAVIGCSGFGCMRRKVALASAIQLKIQYFQVGT